MIVSPELMSASNAPKAKPLKSCDTKFGQAIMDLCAKAGGATANADVIGVAGPSTPATPAATISSISAEVAPERVRLLHQAFARNNFEDLPEVLLVLHGLWVLAAYDNHRANELVVLGAEMHIADHGWEGLALFIGLDHIRRVEIAGLFDHAGPDRELHVGILCAPLGLVAILLVERLDEHLSQRVLVLERPPEIGRRKHPAHDLRSYFL